MGIRKRREGNRNFYPRDVEKWNRRCETAGFAVRGKGGATMATLAEVRREPGKMPEPTVSVEPGIYKEWWANPAVVGLMGFATTTMATGLHNVG